MIPPPTRRSPPPLRLDAQDTRQRIERPLLSDDRVVGGAPPVPRQELRRYAVAACTVPDEDTAGPQDAGEPVDHPLVVSRVHEEPEGREEIDDGIELSGPPARKRAHVTARVSQPGTDTPFPCLREQRPRVVEPVHVEARLGQQMRMTSLTAGTIEDTRTDGKLEELDQPRDVGAIADGVEQRLILEQIPRVEIRGPPLGQKNTGSRYAPKTSSSAARISYSVQ